MQILKRGKSYRACKTWLQGGLLTSCMCFATLADALSVQKVNGVELIPANGYQSIGIPEGDVWLNARLDIRNNQPMVFDVVDPQAWNHQLNLTITYDRFGDVPFNTEDPNSLLNDELTALDVTITGKAAGRMTLQAGKGFQVDSKSGGAGIVTSSNNGNGQTSPGIDPDNPTDADWRTFTLTVTSATPDQPSNLNPPPGGDPANQWPMFAGDTWTIIFGGVWSLLSEAETWDYRITVTPYYASNVSSVPIPGAVWLLGSGLVGLLAMGRKRNSA